jgi:RNA polymerase sigma-70 factor (ECF subfamily)
VQDILLEVWTTASRFDPELGSATTYVATLARRRLIDRLRHQNARRPMEELDDGDAASADDPAETRLMLSSVSTALRQLRPDHRKVLEMSLVEGYTHAEIAQTLQLPLGTVKTITRLVQQVRDELCQGLAAIPA